MPKIVQYNLPPGGTVVQVADNNATALDIESTDAKDYITVDTTDSGEKVVLSQKTLIADGTASGNIGQVQTNADAFIIDSTSDTGMSICLNGNNPGRISFIGVDNADVVGFRAVASNTTTNGLTMLTNGQDRIKIDSTGLVGIGETSPSGHWAGARDLVVKGSNNCGITLRAAASSYSSTITAADADGTSAEGVGGMLQYVHNADYWRFYSKWAGTGDYSWRMNEYGVQRQHFSLAENSTALGDETSSNRAAYLDDSGATLIINMALGCAGTVTLTANVTAVKFLYATSYGSAQNFTLKIKQHASAAKTVSYSSVTQYVGADGSTAKGTSMLWAGGADHVMSTGTSDIDIVNFACIPNSDADRVVYASVVGQNFS